MTYNFIFGAYRPSFLLISINIPDSLERLEELDPVDQSVFLHEYTHYLQNITSGFGHTHIWNTYDRARQIIADQQKNGLNELKIPLENQVAEAQRTFLRALKEIAGSHKVPIGMVDAAATIQSVKLTVNEPFKLLYPANDVRLVSFQLQDQTGGEGEYIFGETAVCETMAYLMEIKFYGETDINTFPYRACQKLGEWMGTDLLEDSEVLFAMCDVSLLSEFPGRIFYQILLEMHKNEFKPSRAEEVYDYGIAVMESMGFNVWQDFEISKNGCITVLKELFQHPLFSDTLAWFIYVLENGYQLRKQSTAFMLSLYREEKMFTGLWNYVVAQLGTPQIHNLRHERFFKAPLELTNRQHFIDPILLLSLEQVHDVLIKTKRECGLFDACRQEGTGIMVDERCTTSPWLRTTDDYGCCFAALWTNYGLNQKKIIDIPNTEI